MFRSKWWVALWALLVIVVAGCGDTSDETAADDAAGSESSADSGETDSDADTSSDDETDAGGDPIVIGHVGDFSDVYSFYDIPVRDGAQYAIDKINAAGGVLGRQLELKAVDGRNDQAETTRSTEELIDSGISYLIGTTGDPFLAQASLACDAGLAISTGDGTAPTLVGDAGDCAYQVIMSDNLQGAVAAEYARDQGYSSAYLLSSAEYDYTNFLPQYFAVAFENGGGEISGEATYAIDSGDFSAQVTEIGALDPAPDVIFTPMFIPDTPVFMRQLRQAGIDIPVISADGNHDVSLLDAGDAVEGMVFTTHAFPGEGTALAGLFEEIVSGGGGEPDSVVFGLGYDEIHMIAGIIEAQGSADRASILSGLPSLAHDGVTGSVKMDSSTRRADKSVALVQVVDGGFELVDQFAPDFVPPVG